MNILAFTSLTTKNTLLELDSMNSSGQKGTYAYKKGPEMRKKKLIIVTWDIYET